MEWLIGCFAVSCALTATGAFFAWRTSVKRRMKIVRATAIGKVKGARVKIVGRVELKGAPLEAPLSGRRCAAYQVVIEDPGAGNPEVLRETRFTDFWILDATGRALVSVAEPQVHICKDRHYKTDEPAADMPDQRIQKLLERQGPELVRWLGSRALVYEEGILEEGETIAVIGVCRREIDPDPAAAHGYRQQAERIVIAGDLISDDPETTS